MASVSKSGTPSICTAAPGNEHSVSGLQAGAALAAGDACYIKSSDGKVYPSNGTSANAAAVCDGFAPAACPIGEYTSLYFGVNFQYGSGLTPGAFYYVDSAVAGGLSDAATTGGTTAVGRSIDATRIYVKKSY